MNPISGKHVVKLLAGKVPSIQNTAVRTEPSLNQSNSGKKISDKCTLFCFSEAPDGTLLKFRNCYGLIAGRQ